MWRAFREDYFAVPDILARKKEFVICRHVERNLSARPPRMATNGLRSIGIFAIEKKIGLKVDVVIRYIGTST